MNKEDKNGKKPKLNASDLLSKIKPYLQEENILEEKKEEITDNSDPYRLVDESSQGMVEHEVAELEEDVPFGVDSDTEDADAEYLAHEAEVLHSNVQDDDYDLMSIFGVDSEKAEQDDTEEQEKRESKKIKELNFFSSAQKANAMKYRKKRCLVAIIGFVGTAILLLFSVLIEGASSLGFNMPAFFDLTNYTRVALLMALQIVVLAVAMQYKLFFRSIEGIFSGNFGAGTVFAVYALLLSVYYTVLFAFDVRSDVITYNTVLLLAALVSLLSEILENASVIYNLKVLCSDKEKNVLVELGKKQSRDVRSLVGKYLDPTTSYLACARTKNVNDFNSRVSRGTDKRKIIGVLLIVSLIMAAVFAVFGLYREGWHSALKFALNGFMFMMPLSAALAFSLPAYSQNRFLSSKGATVVGERSFEQYKTPACLVIEDKEMFEGDGGVIINGIQGYGDGRIDTALGYAAAIFSKLDCPLGEVFARTASDYNVSSDVDIVFVDEDGIEGAVEGIGVFIGTYSFIKKHKMLPRSETDAYETDDCYIYIAIDKQTCLRVQLGYLPSARFVKTLKKLVKKDVNIIIKTCDPNINMKSVERLLGIGSSMPVRVLRIGDAENAKYGFSEECSSGVVTVSGLRSLASAFAGSSRVCSLMRAGMIFAVLCLILAVVIMFVLAGTVGCSGVSPLVILAYQLFWILPIPIIDRILL